ncbi:MAG: DUF664 domain-containing protein [Corynebacterium sp.]|uniref:mycothiol transferase n=1 Tax=Corynebacterium sp. TaxID=1720 RepID=UPI0026DC6492|nr:DUF664 domain-containing protein [Corynebacterium sp.]MDO5029349.1 DUF664 domain-containing protein [Corynebacterium sp.]
MTSTNNPEWPLDSHILASMDKLAALVEPLDDGTFNATLPIPAINSLAVLLRHVTGSARYWLEAVCLGRNYVRDREGEFSANCSVADRLEIYHRDRAAIESALAELQGMNRSQAPAVIPTDKERWWCASIEGVIVHVFHEAAQHLGHAEITRDALATGLGTDSASGAAGATDSALDTVIDVLRQVGHSADHIEHATDGRTHIETVDGRNVVF